MKVLNLLTNNRLWEIVYRFFWIACLFEWFMVTWGGRKPENEWHSMFAVMWALIFWLMAEVCSLKRKFEKQEPSHRLTLTDAEFQEILGACHNIVEKRKEDNNV